MHKRWTGFALAIGAVVLAFGVRQTLVAVAGELSPYITFYPAVALVALIAGLRAGLLATVLAAFAADYWILPPTDHLKIHSAVDALGLGIFSAMGIAMSIVAELFLRARQREVAHREQALAAVETERQRLLLAVTLASIGDGVITTDAEGRVTFLNGEAERLTGWRNDEAVGQPLLDVFNIVNEQTRQPVENPVEKVLRLGMVVGLANHTILVARDGRETPVDDSGAPVRQANGTVQGVVLVFRDITDRRSREEEIRSIARFPEENPGPVLRLSRDGNVLYANRAAETFLLEEGWVRGGPPPPILWQRAESAFRTGAMHEFDLPAHDGRVISFCCVPVAGAGYANLYAQDVTARKRAEEGLLAAKESADNAKAAAELANRAKDYFLAVLSHELRTPLTPVLMAVSMLQRRPDLDQDLRTTLEMVRSNIEMEARLIDDLLDVNRIAKGKIELQKQTVELRSVIQRAVEVCQPDIEARGLNFGIDLGPDAPYWVEADVGRLQQVFWNLLKNAIKFTSHGGCVGICCRLDQNGCVVVEVNDSGIGIEPSMLPQLFNAFAQAERSITRQFGGLGLGLTISKALVEMHGGTIDAHSEGKDKGATFRVRLPLAASTQQPETPSPAPTDRNVAGPLRILLVEDHAISAKMIRMVLMQEGHEVETADDMATALELAGRQHFDLLISDLGLPDGSGHDLLRHLRRQDCRFPAIALSGYGQEEDIQRSREAGFAVHLTKPATRESLVEAIASVVSAKDK